MSSTDRCKGVDDAITPRIFDVICPECGAELELFSTDESVTCECGAVIENKHNPALTLELEHK
ncbi:MAG: phage terminase large subunit family protein [Oscillospiraceae bacterium]|nr:phage terminase large subunit family protein [Oscillospiraceae bacterium]